MTLKKTNFDTNTGYQGGSIALFFDKLTSLIESVITFDSVKFLNNKAIQNGGAIFISESSTLGVG